MTYKQKWLEDLDGLYLLLKNFDNNLSMDKMETTFKEEIDVSVRNALYHKLWIIKRETESMINTVESNSEKKQSQNRYDLFDEWMDKIGFIQSMSEMCKDRIKTIPVEQSTRIFNKEDKEDEIKNLVYISKYVSNLKYDIGNLLNNMGDEVRAVSVMVVALIECLELSRKEETK